MESCILEEIQVSIKYPHTPPTQSNNKFTFHNLGLTTDRIYAFTIDYKNGGLIFYKEDAGDQKIVWGEKSMPFKRLVNAIVAHCCEDIIYWITNENIYSWDGKSAEYTTLPYVFEFYISFGIIDMTIDCVTKYVKRIYNCFIAMSVRCEIILTS